MCQLTYLNLKTEWLNQLFTTQMAINSITQHKDGYGFFNSSSGVIKSANAASNIIDLPLSAKLAGVDKSPVICHVRQATATGGRKVIRVENSHPFEGDRFVLAHNGSLESTITGLMTEKRFDGMIDSAIFAADLEEAAKNSPDTKFIELLKDVYEKRWEGKFAFLIYDKQEGVFYGARGTTARLHCVKIYINGVYQGYVVNTDKDSLSLGMLLISNFLSSSGKRIDSDCFSKIEELPENTIFRFDKEDISIVGKINEVKKYSAPLAQTTGGHTASSTDFGTKPNVLWNTDRVLVEVMDTLSIDFVYLDMLCYYYIGKQIAEIDSFVESKTFADILVGAIEGLNKKKVSLWKQIVDISLNQLSPHQDKEFPLPFPYFQNPNSLLREYIQKQKKVWKESV